MSPAQGLPPAGWLERRAQPAFRFRKRSRTVLDTAEEAYLRVDIACGAGAACAACPPTAPALALQEPGPTPGAPPPHLLLPDAAVLGECLEVLELPQLANVVLLSSELRQLADGGNMRRSQRLRALYTDRRRHSVLFDNLHHRETAPAGGRPDARVGLALLAAAEWYHQHLGRRWPVVVLSDALARRFGEPVQQPAQQQQQQQQQQAAAAAPRALAAAGAAEPDDDAELDALLQQMHIGGGAAVAAAPAAGSATGAADIAGLLDGLGIGDGKAPAPAALAAQEQQQQQPQQQPPLALEPGLHILSTAAYFGGCWGGVPAVADAFDSVQQARAEEAAVPAGEGGTAHGAGFRPHLSQSALKAGLASGALLAGTLCVSRRARDQASVAVGAGRQVLVSGRGAMNRAVHGDRVALRLLPREQWRPAAELVGGGYNGTDGEGGEGEDEGDSHDLLASAGDGEATAEAAADEAHGVGGDDDEPLDAVAALLRSADADALQPAAEVVGVLQRWAGEVVACLTEDDEAALAARGESSRQEAVLCVPADRRLPKIRLRSRQLHRLLGQRLVLRLDGWELGSRYPHGHLVRALGPINSLTSETDGVLVGAGVHWQPFSEGALRELPPVRSSAEYRVPPGELAARRDLRGPEYLICSIDPPGCTDVDDALSVRWLDAGTGTPNGGRRLVEVGVHIADVSFFVRQGGLLDAEAAARCTTVYLVDRRLDMLPALLSEDLCSLRGGQDRYAVSVLWTLDADSLEVLGAWFGRTMIRSRYQLEYSQAQDIADERPPRAGHDVVAPADRAALQRNLRLLGALAEARRRGRLAAGAVELESAELRFGTEAGSGRPTSVAVKQEVPMMAVVAELMIMANEAVGRALAAAFPRAALLRRHPPPRREALGEVATLCEALGTPLALDAGPAALSASLAAAAAGAPAGVGSLIKGLATRAMSEAQYCCTGDAAVSREGAGWGHYGLALPHYTHFTSPIRRYADVVVHRQLLAAVAAGAVPGGAVEGSGGGSPTALSAPAPVAPPLPGGEVAKRAAVMNERHRAAKRAQKECSDLFLLLLLQEQPRVEAATVYALRPGALLAFVPRYHLKGVLHLTDKAGLCKPPLRGRQDEAADDPSGLAYRAGLALVPEGGDPERPRQLAVVDAGSGSAVATFRPMQRVWVQLSADRSRAHGPRLRLRLLADSHPDAQAAAAREAAEAAAAPAPASSGLGCGQLARPPAARGAYRPPGAGPPAGAVAASQAPPPGFEAAAVAAVAVETLAAAAASEPAAAPAGSLAGQLAALLEQAGGSDAEAQALAWQAVPGLLPVSSSGSSGPDERQQGAAEQAVRQALRRLHGEAARLALRAGAGRRRAAECGAREAALRQQIATLQQLVPG